MAVAEANMTGDWCMLLHSVVLTCLIFEGRGQAGFQIVGSCLNLFKKEEYVYVYL